MPCDGATDRRNQVEGGDQEQRAAAANHVRGGASEIGPHNRADQGTRDREAEGESTEVVDFPEMVRGARDHRRVEPEEEPAERGDDGASKQGLVHGV